ncbi:MAG TPA: P1 family peptidase [Chloroflexota bacterium]|nr:P1 family peptidase [Chloroflexota bacterium]
MDAITDVGGIAVGSVQDRTRCTGCTVVLSDPPAVVGADVRGPAPATRETDLCRPGTLVERADAVFLTGGSAFGLDAAAGVMGFLHAQSRGFPTATISVPIVPAAAIYDLAIGEVGWPDAAMAYEACRAASTKGVEQGSAGAGTGAVVGRLLGPGGVTKGGLGTASVRSAGVTVGALVVVNAVGNVVDPATGRIVAGARSPETGKFVPAGEVLEGTPQPRGSTVIGVVATDARLDSMQTNQLAAAAQDGLARCIMPAHTVYDGDAIFTLSTGRVSVEWPRVQPALVWAAVTAVERAVLNAVLRATSLGGVPACRDLPNA